MLIRLITLLLFCFFLCDAYAQQDSVVPVTDSVITPIISNTYHTSLKNILSDNAFLNEEGKPESLAISIREYNDEDIVFYAIVFLLLLFGLLRTFYSRYLNNMFRVFFNTSLRQNQLTDQLLQSNLASLFFNIFFVIMGGFYVFFLLEYLGHIDPVKDQQVLFFCIAAIAVVYMVKYCVLKFTGWLSGFRQEAGTYIFIVFLINKIIGIVLIPIVIILAFSDKNLAGAFVLISYLIIFIMLMLRFLRSWSVLQNKIKVKRYHFFLYIIGVEILPLLLIYKGAMDFLKNNL